MPRSCRGRSESRADRTGLRDAATAELVLNYPGHEAWYCDSVSILRKLLQARENGIGRAAFWVLGAEDPRLWEMLEDFPVPFI